ncbi:glycosyltransferase [Kushneria konosiri]|uniref:Glycosyl transferase family 1 domain-containing protein n=1 Tax=Kushneria konosiri TaxID=698828 RepID=A0A2Z2H9S0_9GAMM|nr:glycosyltransferase [Kushneria konosiri]ARS54108.1 hypothetical protein B9G99_15470 [Kushneria konosiri]
MKVAQIITELKPSGPANVVKNIVGNMPDHIQSKVFYFRGPPTLDVDCECEHINFNTSSKLKDFDIIHSHGIRPDFLALYAGLLNKKVLTVSTLHNYVKDELLNIYGPKAARFVTPLWINAWSRMNGLAVLTQDAFQYYSPLLGSEKLNIIHNGIKASTNGNDADPDDQNKLKALGEKYYLLGTNAHIIKRKGIDQVVEALKYLPDFALVVVGDGPCRQDLIQLSEEHGVSERCWFTGYRSNVASFLPYYDIYVMPSRSEGFGLALLEAMAAHLPCVCSDIGVFREIMGEQASFFTLENIDSFCESVRSALACRKQFAENGYQRYLEKFTGKAMGEAYANFYDEQLAKYS